ncbi:MAG TPA: hypothetical protein PKI03_06185, partial [Pseudomonadota bacterium]|nr:hypothetical protein [Pseudomonadota bacterium]
MPLELGRASQSLGFGEGLAEASEEKGVGLESGLQVSRGARGERDAIVGGGGEFCLGESEHARGGVAERMMRVDGEALGEGVLRGGHVFSALGGGCGGFCKEATEGFREGPPGVWKGLWTESSEPCFVESEEECGQGAATLGCVPVGAYPLSLCVESAAHGVFVSDGEAA